ncbi:MAG: sulfotransferase [Pseudomonadota bacterium]
MAHPLSGANLATLRSVFADAGPADDKGAAVAIWAAAYARWPSTALERQFVRLPAPDRDGPPLFVLGHWRSGTTHLYNLLAAGGWGYVPPIEVGLPHDARGLARLLRPMLERQLPETRWIDRIPVTPTAPQEDEIGIANMSPLSFYHGIYFPRHFDRLIDRGLFFDGCGPDDIAAWQSNLRVFLAKIAAGQNRRLAIKNPVYTGRPAMLRAMFPSAKFIHIHRNPVDVFLSMRNFYARLLEVMALQDVPDDLDIDGTILRVYDRMMNTFSAQTEDWAEPDFVELPYAELDAAPMDALARIYDALELPGFAAAAPAFEGHLAAVKSFEKNRFATDPLVARKLADAWGRWFTHFGYPLPSVEPEGAKAQREAQA